ncbi:MAG: class I SAM-dependent methyltransferase [Bacteroidia bacterium]|nr:class I SAM-dependent methyltransferase [Bacteroidia bacterium]
MEKHRTGSEWFADWFDSDYYHILYQHRDDVEAAQFLDNLIAHLDVDREDQILDLACGKGRHSQYLNDRGFNVIGLDYSSSNIIHCKEFENDRLHFYEHDMRNSFRPNSFDLTLNLFTSFGYFDNEEDNCSTIKSIAKDLKKGGHVVIDFLISVSVINNIVEEEDKNIDGLHFNITKKLDHKTLVKTIDITDKQDKLTFQERVTMLTLENFKTYFKIAGLELISTFGDYSLNVYNESDSERLILIARKP